MHVSSLPVEMRRGRVLLINPSIHDFAAYDFWLRPTGLLYIASKLRRWGFEVHFIDCLDRYNPRLLERQKRSSPREKPDGRGKFHKEEIARPPILRGIPRRYSRYGLPPDILLEELASVPTPDVMLMTSSMTYWYPGVQETILLAKRVFPGTKVVLGGTYATLLPEHARVFSGADHVAEGDDSDLLRQILEQVTGGRLQAISCGQAHVGEKPVAAPERRPSLLTTSGDGYSPDEERPAYDLLSNRSSIVIHSSWGCPFRCSYCASWKVSKGFRQRNPHRVVDEIEFLSREYGTKDFVFFDDALLYGKEKHFQPMIEEIIRKKIKASFHTPNAIHARYVDREAAALMREANFQTICLGLETASPEAQVRTGGKINNPEFERAVAFLEEAGFPRRDIEVYAMMGLPGQGAKEVRQTLRFINAQGCTIRLACYSPIPGTDEWARAVASSELPLTEDPLLHNGSIYPVRNSEMTWEIYEELKALAAEMNSGLSGAMPAP